MSAPLRHASDCASHNAPAGRPGPCDCGAEAAAKLAEQGGLDRPAGGKLFNGVWLPETEEHFVDWMANSKRAMTVNGKATYQYHKIEAMLGVVDARMKTRRRYVDIGAHVGLWAMWVCRYFERTTCFEPVPLHVRLMELNMPPAGRGGADWECHQVALSDANEGWVDMEVAADETGSFHVHDPRRPEGDADPRQGHGEIVTVPHVPVRTLDSFGYDDVDCVKIDVEGWELPVVRGAAETIRRCRPVVVVEQKGNDAGGYGHPRGAAAEFLRGLGMRDAKVISGDHIMVF